MQVPIVIDGIATIINESIKCLDLPLPHGQKHFTSPPTRLSKGISADRLAVWIMNEVMCLAAMALQQTVEMTAIHNGEQQLCDINPWPQCAQKKETKQTINRENNC